MMKKKVLAAIIIGGIMFGDLVSVNAATMKRTMNWVSYAVAITNSYSDTNYSNQCILYAYDKENQGGNIVDASISDETYGPASLAINNSKTKSAYAKHYALMNGTVYEKHTYARNKGEGYSY